jgi:hypothetical protein
LSILHLPLIGVPGSSASKDEYSFPHYDYTIYFKWISPDPVKLPSTVAKVNIDRPTEVQRTHFSWGHETTNPQGPTLEDDPINPRGNALIDSNKVYHFHSDVVEAVNPITISLDAGGSVVHFEFPAKTQ